MNDDNDNDKLSENEARSVDRLSNKIDNLIREHSIDANIEDVRKLAFVMMSALSFSTAKILYLLGGPGERNHTQREHLRAAYDGILMDAYQFVENRDKDFKDGLDRMLDVIGIVRDHSSGSQKTRLDDLINSIKNLDSEKPNESKDETNLSKFGLKRPPKSFLN